LDEISYYLKSFTVVASLVFSEVPLLCLGLAIEEALSMI